MLCSIAIIFFVNVVAAIIQHDTHSDYYSRGNAMMGEDYFKNEKAMIGKNDFIRGKSFSFKESACEYAFRQMGQVFNANTPENHPLLFASEQD